jgi:hypothetical protein
VSRLAYFEWSADPDPDAGPDDPDRWADANPALGIRITEDAIRTELLTLEPADFDRERLGLFPESLDAQADPAIPDEDWSACERRSSSLLDPVVLSFEVSPDRRWGVIAAAGLSSLGGLHVEMIEQRRYTGWMVERMVELVGVHSPVAVVAASGGPAGALLPDMGKAGVEVTECGGADVVKACGLAFDDIVEHRWCHIGQPVVNLAVAESAKRSVGDAWVFDRRGAADVSALSAVVLAAWGARTAVDELSVYEERGLLIL